MYTYSREMVNNMDRYLHEEYRLLMVRRARSFGVASVIFLFLLFSFPIVAGFLGFFAIFFAILSKGYNDKMDREAALGVKLGIVSILISLTITASAYIKLYTDADFRRETFSYIDSIYGEQYKNEFGATPSELVEKWIGGASNAK